MQTTRKAVRYYIDREADTPVIRTVPVSCATAGEDPTTELSCQSEQDATSSAATEGRRRDTRHRITNKVQARVRKHRHLAS